MFWPVALFCKCTLTMISYHRSGEAWKKARDAVSQQIRPSNVQTYSPGLNGVASRFVEHLKSVRDKNDRISDVSRPLRRLLMESELNLMSGVIDQSQSPLRLSYYYTVMIVPSFKL